MEKDLTRGKPARVLLRFALPVIGGNLFQLFYTLADSVIVGRTLGADALAAVGSTSIIIYLVLCFIQGFTGGFGICLGQRFGAKDQSGMERSVRISWLLSLFFTVVLTVVCCLLAHPILRWMQTPDAIYTEAYDYMFVILLGTGATIFYNMISNMLRALGDSRTPVIFLVVSSLGNVALDVLFIVPMKMGVAGAAWATVLSQLISAVLCTIVGVKNYPVMRQRLSSLFMKEWRSEAAAHLKIGFPMGFQMSVMCIGQLAMQAAVNALGPSAIAGYTAATKVDQFSVLMNNAIGIATANYVAQNYGAKAVRPYSGGRSSGTLSVDDRQCADGRVNARLPQAGGFSVYRRTDRSRGGICCWLSGSGRAILSAAWLPVGIPFRRAKHGGQSLAVYGLHGGTSAANRCNDVPFPADRLYRRMSGQPAGLAGCDLSADPRVLPAHEAADPRCVNLHEKGVSCIIGNGLTV